MCVWVIIQKWIYLPALQWSSNISVNHMVTIWQPERHTKKPNTLEKSSKPARLDQQRDLPFFVSVNTHAHIYIKSLLCKIFQS